MTREYYNYVDCINNENLSLIETSLIEILYEEGFKQIEIFPKHILIDENLYYSRRRYWRLIKEVLVISLFPGASGWTIIKTIPKEFLCRRSSNNLRPRLSKLAILINCQAFHWSIYQSNFGVLLEANKEGNIFVSGSHSLYKEFEQDLYYQEIINYKEEWKFHLLDIPKNLKKAIEPPKREEFEKAAIRLDELIALSSQGIDTFEEMMELDFDSGTTADLAFKQFIGNNSPYWTKGGNFYVLYTEEEKIKSEGGKVLYFETPQYYQKLNSFFDIAGRY